MRISDWSSDVCSSDLEFMTRPSRALAADLAALDGDIMILGVGGKMGPTMARLAKRAAPDKRVIGVARFSEKGLKEGLERHGIETNAAHLMDRAAVDAPPRAKKERKSVVEGKRVAVRGESGGRRTN